MKKFSLLQSKSSDENGSSLKGNNKMVEKITDKVSQFNKEPLKRTIMLIIFFFLASIFVITPLLSGGSSLKSYRGDGALVSTSVISMYKNPLLSIRFLFKNPLKILSLIKSDCIILALWALVVSVMKVSYKNDDGIVYREKDGTYGTARWMHDKEAMDTIDVGKDKAGIKFGDLPSVNKGVKLPLDSYIFNKNVAVFGGPGSGKSRTYVRNNVFELVKARQSILITDPKGELFRDMFMYLKAQNYNVKVLNLVNLANSDRWNPLNEVTDDLSAQMFTEVVMANTTAPGNKGDGFWEKGEQNLLKALLLYVIKECPEEDRNLKNLYALISHTDAQQLDSMFKRLPNSHSAKAPYNIFCQASEQVRTGIIIGLGTRLQIIQNIKVQELTSASDIDLTAPGKEPCVYFCITSDTNSTFDFLSGLFFSFLFINLINYADLHDGQCTPNVFCLLDEIANIAAIPDFIKKISTMRSRGIHSHVIFQNIGQLQNRYPDNGWSEIIGACDSKLFLGCTDLLTAEFMSKLLGTTTVEDVGKSKQAGFDGIWDLGKETRKGTKRNLLNPDEVLAYPYKNAILMLKGQKPLKLEKFDFSKYPEAKELNVIQISDYCPDWAMEFNSEANETNEDVNLKRNQEMENKKESEDKKVKSQKKDASKKNSKSTPSNYDNLDFFSMFNDK